MVLKTVGEGAERLMCIPHAQPWAPGPPQQGGRSTTTLGNGEKPCQNEVRFFELFVASYLCPVQCRVIYNKW